MKKFTSIFLFFFLCRTISSQVVLTHTEHSPKINEKVNFIEIEEFNPGIAGKNIKWDFTNIKIKEKNKISEFIPTDATSQTSFTIKPNIANKENNRTNFLFLDNNSYSVVGFIEKDLILNYEIPLERLKFPFKFGVKQTSDLKARADYLNNGHTISLYGTNEIEADTYGVLVLPGNKIINTLRIRQTTKFTQISICEVTEVEINRYAWYSNNERYPLIVTNHQVHKNSNGNTTIIKEYHINQKVFESNIEENFTNNTSLTNFHYNVFPNPFVEEQNLAYILESNSKVNIEIFDMLGRKIFNLVNNENQEKGVYNYTIDSKILGLNAGIYLLKIQVNDREVTEKVIKSY